MRGGGLRRHQPVFELGDEAGDDLDRIAPAAFVLVGREVQRLHDAAKYASGVVSIEDVEAFPQGRDFRRSAKLTGREAVECAEPIGRRVRAERGADAVRHLAGRLVGERDGEHPMGPDAVDRDAVRDGGGEGRGLARSGPGQDQDRARMSCGRDLGLCQGRGDRVERGGCIAGPLFEWKGLTRDRIAGDGRPFVVSRVFGARIVVDAGIVEVRPMRHDRLPGMASQQGMPSIRRRAFGMATCRTGTHVQACGSAP